MKGKRGRPGRAVSELILVPVDPVRRRRLRLLAGLGILVLVLGALMAGRVMTERADRQAMSERSSLLQETRELSNNLRAAREELALHRTGSEMATQAQEQLRQELRGLRDQIAELEEAVAFYKNVMSPGSGEEGLRIERFELARMAEAGVYHYRLVLTQVGDNTSFIAGQVNVSVDGISDGEALTVQTDQLVVDGSETRFRFRYFQELDGRVRLPEGLDPTQIRVEAIGGGRGGQTVERNFSWQVQERDGAWAG